ncbi:MAG TPA: pitrilysin family protein [Gemmatimonadales bacterium]
MRRTISALATAAMCAGSALGAQEPGRITSESYTLPNGLTVVLAEDHTAQVVAVDVWYDVGSRNERPGRSGFAHLFEHMMFQGSENVGKGEHFQLIERAGGTMNGSTAEDRTNYFQALPSNRLNLALWLEADRMRSLAITAENLDNQTEAVKEERRLRVDNPPYTRVFYEETYAAFDSASCFPYAHSVIGSMKDLDAADTADVQSFFDMYYAPNNATLVVTGDFQPAEAKRLIEQYFGSIPRGQAPPPVECEQPFNTGQVRRNVVDPNANLPAIAHVYRVPAYDAADMPALELLATILGQGESSRLNRAMARDAKAAAGTQAMLNPFGPRRGPGIFLFFAVANQGVSADSLDTLLAGQIALIAREGVTVEELTKAQNLYRAGTIMERQTALSVAEALQRARMFLGSADAVNTELDRYMKVTTDDVRRVAAKYLRPDNSLVMLITTENKAS